MSNRNDTNNRMRALESQLKALQLLYHKDVEYWKRRARTGALITPEELDKLRFAESHYKEVIIYYADTGNWSSADNILYRTWEGPHPNGFDSAANVLVEVANYVPNP